MNTSLRRLMALAACGAAAFAITACGGDDEGGGGGAEGGSPAAKTGGNVTINYTSFPDYLDPALSYTVEGWEAMWNVYTPLVTYKHAEGADGSVMIPGLAQDLPEISQDGKEYKLTLREGLEYSDGTAVKASDFEHTIKRVLNMESGGAAFYQVIEGAEEYLEKGKARADISGIDTNDETGEITIRLTRPDGSFTNVLAMNFAGLVPGDTPFENQTKNPPAGVGPLKFSNVRTGRGFTLEKNERFPADIDGVPTPRLDRIKVDVVKNQRRQVQDIIRNQVDYAIDPPPADQLREVKSRYGDRYEEFTTNSTYYVFLNTRTKPFDNEKVRQAVNVGLDKRALARLYGGLLEPGCNFLPPGMQGYRKIEPCPYGDPNQPPDLEKARQMIREAGAEGANVTVWGNDEDPSKPVTEYVADQMSKIGLNAKPKIVEASVYFQTIGNQKTKAQAGFANWFQDFPHPANFMFLVDGDTIQQTNNQNFSNADVPELNQLIDKADRMPRLEDAADLYSQADRMVVEKALVAPYGHRKLANFVSERIDFENCTVTHPLYLLDFAQLCLK